MRAEWIAEDRNAEVRAAAKAWAKAGAIDGATRAAIDARHPAGETLNPVFRALLFFFVSSASLTFMGAFVAMLNVREKGLGVIALLAGTGFALATEILRGRPRLTRAGIIGAGSFWAATGLFIALGIGLEETYRSSFPVAFFLAAGAAIFGLAGWRWGVPFHFLIATVLLFGALARGPQPRLVWFGAAVAAALATAPLLDRAALAPSHRSGAAFALAGALAAGYVAANVYAADRSALDLFVPNRVTNDPGAFRFLAIAGTALVPVILLAWGVRSRRTLILDAGLVATALSLVTLRMYVHVAPLWVVLAAGGAALFGVAFALERSLRRAPGNERQGFTVEPLLGPGGRESALEIAGAMAAFGARPEPGTPAAAEPTDYQGGGGSFGGGGASQSF